MEFWWFWLGIIVLAMVVEVASEELISIWFIPGAIVAIIFDMFWTDLIWQVIIFLAISIAGIVFGRRYFASHNDAQATKTNIEAIIGEKCLVIEKINNFAGCGQVKVKGNVWSARGVSDEDEFEAGEVLRIVAIEGVKLICKKDQ